MGREFLGDAQGARQARRVSQLPLTYWVVRRRRGGPWDWSRGMREQEGWDEHARFMDSLVDEGFILLGGPLEDDRDVLHIVAAPSKAAVHERLADDNWTQDGKLETVSVEGWTVLLDGRN
jgi:uncharacterized protein YciI